jgi:hypothetical protein
LHCLGRDITTDCSKWVRLLGGSSQKKKQAAPNNPQQRLARFRQRYNQILVWLEDD